MYLIYVRFLNVIIKYTRNNDVELMIPIKRIIINHIIMYHRRRFSSHLSLLVGYRGHNN